MELTFPLAPAKFPARNGARFKKRINTLAIVQQVRLLSFIGAALRKFCFREGVT
jgi:hypothetical protein